MSLTFQRATKQALKARIALEGPSGSGKTYTSLVTARALGERIALVDTERRSASLYADLFAFDTLALDRFSPEVLIEALAAAASYDVVIIDSLSHWWMGVDGMLEQVDRAAKRTGGGNTFAGWKEMRPAERRMIDAMLAFPGHLIATLRTKTEWVVEENERGKKVPKKIGLKAEQREGLEYEFTLVAAMDLDNTLMVSKSRCPALSGAVITRPDETFGATLRAWLDDGEPSGPSAAEIRDDILAAHDLTKDEYLAYYQRARAAGLLGAAMMNEVGDTVTLGEWIVERGKSAIVPPTSSPTEPEPTAEPVANQAQHRRMHALWRDLQYDGEHNRDVRLDITAKILGLPDLASSGTLTAAQATKVIEALEQRKREAAKAATP